MVIWDVVDGVLYASLSHWGMFPVSSRTLKTLENNFSKGENLNVTT